MSLSPEDTNVKILRIMILDSLLVKQVPAYPAVAPCHRPHVRARTPRCSGHQEQVGSNKISLTK